MTDVATAASEVTPDRPAVEEAVGVSILRRAQEVRAQAKDELALDIPSWDGALIGHYQIVDRGALMQDAKKILARSNGKIDANSGLQSDIKFLLRAIVGFSVRDPESGTVIRLQDESEYDIGIRELPRYLGITDEVDTPDDVVLYLFKNNSIAISAHAITVARWMRDPSKPVGDGLLGE